MNIGDIMNYKLNQKDRPSSVPGIWHDSKLTFTIKDDITRVRKIRKAIEQALKEN